MVSSDSDTSPPLPGVSADRLRNELAVATAAAVDAYRHTSRLIRVLTVLGQPSSPTGLLEQTLTVLSQVYAADVTATVRIVAGRLQLTGACGIPENDPAFADGWPLAGAAAEAVATGRAIARTGPALDPNADVPSSLSDLAAASAVWVPVGEDGTVDELLIMFRTRADGFPPTDLPVLASVASRLRLAVQARRRSASVETLATFGHRLTSRLGLQSLFDEAARLLPLLVDGADGGVLTVRDGVARMRQLTEWQRTAPADRLRISVNHSALQSQQPDAAARTLQTIERAGARPADVWLEITEHSAIRTDVTAFATTLRAAGVHFALDDFGISHSSLSHLKRLPVETLKIDRSFVAGLPGTDTDRGIVRAVLAIADSLGLAVVAEGIETVEQLTDLVALNCRHGQGYLFSRPVPPGEATALLLTGLPDPVTASLIGAV